jgi:hypothetical protein
VTRLCIGASKLGLSKFHRAIQKANNITAIIRGSMYVLLQHSKALETLSIIHFRSISMSSSLPLAFPLSCCQIPPISFSQAAVGVQSGTTWNTGFTHPKYVGSELPNAIVPEQAKSSFSPPALQLNTLLEDIEQIAATS